MGVELPDQPRIIAGEPDIAVLVLGQAMRPRMRRLERIFPDGTRLGIEASQLVGELTGPPDRAVLGCQGIVRP